MEEPSWNLPSPRVVHADSPESTAESALENLNELPLPEDAPGFAAADADGEADAEDAPAAAVEDDEGAEASTKRTAARSSSGRSRGTTMGTNVGGCIALEMVAAAMSCSSAPRDLQTRVL
jgi:hypothetical protein